jgi:hypothetical protein
MTGGTVKCEAERATTAKAIAAYVSLAEPLDTERAWPWWRRVG